MWKIFYIVHRKTRERVYRLHRKNGDFSVILNVNKLNKLFFVIQSKKSEMWEGNRMNKRGAGVTFIAIAAFLISAKYISAAVFGSGVSSWDENLFREMSEYVGIPLNICSVLALLVGLAYIVWAEYEEFMMKNKNS